MTIKNFFPTLLLAMATFGISANGAEKIRRADLFAHAKIWRAELKFTDDQWTAMEPKGGEGGFNRMFGGGPPGPGMMLAPLFMRAGDQDGDQKISEKEFSALGEKWFADWDKSKGGKLTLEQVNAGIGSAMGGGGNFGGPQLQGREGQRNGLASMMGVEFNYAHADLEFEGKEFKNVATRVKGNGTFMEVRGALKRSLKVDLNEFVKGQKLAGISKLNFHNNTTDPSYMNETLAYRLFRDAGVAAPETSFVKLFVNVPGVHDHKFFGLYSLVENVDGNFVEDHFKEKEGAILKPTTRTPFTDLGNDWKNYTQIYDPKTELTAEQKQRVIALCKLVSNGTDAEFAAQIGNFVDLENFAKFMAVTVYLSSGDSILSVGQNYYVYLHPKSQKFYFIPWDHDHSFADFLSGVGNFAELSINHPWSGDNRFLARIFAVPAFKEPYLANLREWNKSLFAPERIIKQVNDLAPIIRPVVKEESSERLARFDKVMAGEMSPGQGFGAMMASKPIKAFVGPRQQSITDQLAGKSEGTKPGGFGPFGRGGGRGGGGPQLGRPIMSALDRNQDAALDHAEFTEGFAKWFKDWDEDKNGSLAEEEMRTHMNRDFPSPFGGPGGPPPQ